LALYASLAAPNLPSSVTKIFKNPLFKLGIMFLIAYMATKDTSVAIITAVALLVTLQTLSAHETTQAVVKVVEKKITNFENFAAIPALATSKYDDLLDYSLTNSDEQHIYAGSGRSSNPSLVEASMSASYALPLDEKEVQARQHVFKSQLGGDTYNIIGQEMTSSSQSVMQDSNKPIHIPGAKMSEEEHKQGANSGAEMKKPNMELRQPTVEMKQPNVEAKGPGLVVKTGKTAKTTANDDDEEPSFLDLITGFNNTGSIEPFSDAPHYDIDFEQNTDNKSCHKHHIENFLGEDMPDIFVPDAPEEPLENFLGEDMPDIIVPDAPEEPLQKAGSCGSGGGLGLSVPGFDLGQFAAF
jgi:hypothetical protein